MPGKIIFVVSITLMLFSCASTKKNSSMPNEQRLKAIYSQLQKDAKATLSYSVLNIDPNKENSTGIKFKGEYEILSYQPNQQYSFTISLIVDEKLIQIFEKRLTESAGDILVEKQLTDYVKSQLAKVNTVKVRLNIYEILDEDLNHVQDLCQITSEEIKL